MSRTFPHAVLAMLALVALGVSATTSAAQDTPGRTITGTVRDTSGVPIPFVNVDGPKNLRALSDDEGHFRLVLPTKDAVSLTMRRLGFNALTLRLPAGADTSLNVHLDLIPLQLNAVRIVTQAIQTLRNRGFFARMAEREQGLNTGQFITPEEIELRHPTRPTQLLEGRMSVEVRRVGKCFIIEKCWVVMGPSHCKMQVYLDGQRLNPEGGSALDQNSPPVYLDPFISPSSIAGIEIYPRGASAPPQYQMLNSMCGVVLIWTK